MSVKSLVPPGIKLLLRIVFRRSKDYLTAMRFKFARNSETKLKTGRSFKEQITITQPINVSRWAENKKHNLRLAISKFQNLPFYPGEIFSFWHYVQKPTKRTGYKVGINIKMSKLDFDYGGGLCQLSGLLYHLALTAGLRIVERHPHSVDLYTDETRYTPLGADATTVYGHKDLRLKNILSTPFCFRLKIEGNKLIGSICAPEPVQEYELQFIKDMVDGKERVKTIKYLDSENSQLICTQMYIISDHEEVI